MKIYFWDCAQMPDGFKRIIYVTDQHHRPFTEETVVWLAAKLRCDICFPAPGSDSLLIMSHDRDKPTRRAIRKALKRGAVSCCIYRGGIFSPFLPVRPYDAWFD